MQKQKPVSFSGDSTDTAGMDSLFTETMAADSADTAKKQTMEVSISEAAKILGISERTVWRRVIKKELKSKTKNKKRFVIVPIIEPQVSVSKDCQVNVSETTYNANAVLDLRVLLQELQGANYRIGYLESENKTYQNQVKLLPDLEAKAAKVSAQDETINQLSEELTKLKGSWWYRFVALFSFTKKP
jgi:predicted DNA-binding transcriptional regulator AlpA